MTRTAAFVAAIALVFAACSAGSTTASPSVPAPSPASSSTAGPTPRASPTPADASPPAPAARLTWTLLSQGGAVPAPREDHTWTVDAASGIAWLFGGRDGGTIFDDLWSYDLASDRWTRVGASGEAPAARFGHTGTWVDGVGLVVWSGQAGADFFDDIYAYDPATNRWTRLPDAGAKPDRRYGSCAALGPDGRLWISHGFTFAGRFQDTRAYDFAAGRWAEANVEGVRPVERCLHDCLWTPDGRLVLYAGQTDGVAALGDLWTFDPAGRWTQAETPEPPARQLYALASEGSTGWVLGGRGKDGTYLDDLWTLDLETLAWQSVMPAGEEPPGRAGATLIPDPALGRLILFGGVGESGALADVWQLALR